MTLEYLTINGLCPLLLGMSIAGFILSLFPQHLYGITRILSLIYTLVPMLYCSLLWWSFDASGQGLQMVVVYGRSHLCFGQDALSLSLCVLSAGLFPICILLMRTVSGWVTFVLLEILVLAALCVLDLLGFYVLFESTLILLFLLIGRAPLGSMEAAYKIVMFTMGGSLLLLPVLFLLYSQYGSANLLVLQGYVASNSELASSVATQMVLGWGLLAVFAVKIPLMPVHLWLPEAHVAAPTAGSVLLAGILLKLGGLGFLRFMLPALPLFSVSVMPLMSCMCLVSFLFSTLSTLRQIDLKKIVAYSSIAHMSLVTLAIFAQDGQNGATSNMYEFSASGATLMMVAHGLVSPALFLLVGLLYDRTHTKLLLYLSGLGSHMPIYSFFLLTFTLANLSFPLFPNFVAELLCLISLFAVHELLAYVYCICQVLGAAYGFWALNKVVHGVPLMINPASNNTTTQVASSHAVSTHNGNNVGLRLCGDLSRAEFYMVLPLFLGVLWLGIKPQ